MEHDRRLPPLPWLLAFEAAARHGSFGAAAKALGTSQPAISQRVAGLEASLAVPLFTRAPRGVALTPQGAALLAGLSDGLGRIAQAIDDARRPELRDLTVATDFGFAAFWLVPRLPSLRVVLADHNVRVVTSQEGFDARRGGADVGVVFGPGVWAGCDADLLIPETVLPVCSPHLPASRARGPDDLRTAPLLHLETGPDSTWLDWTGWFHAAGLSFSPGENRVSINNYSLLIQAALAGHGVVLGWRPLVDGFLLRGELVAALDRPVTTRNGYYVVHRRAGGRAVAVRRFKAWLRGQMGEAAGAQSGSRPGGSA